MQIIPGNLYDYPKYYDLVFGSDWKAEFDFLQHCFARHSRRNVQSLFEPACGTGRLMVKLAAAGYRVAGNDLNEKAVRYCNERLEHHGFPATAVVGDMSDFRVAEKFDVAFNMINSFRHLSTEQQARGHLACIAEGLHEDGLYLLGLHLSPPEKDELDEESWSARRGNLAVMSRIWTLEVDLANREEKVAMTFDVYTPTRSFQLADTIRFRTYTAAQMSELVEQTAGLEILETYDFAYNIDRPIEVDEQTEDVVYVLRKC